MSYSAVVARVNVRPHPNADRLQIGNVNGIQVIVGIDTQDNEIGVYFPSDGQLSEEFCAANDLIRRKNEDGTYSGGMFDVNRRVRAMNLRGVKSDGFWCPLDYFNFSAVSASMLKEGDSFTEINGIPICNKYVTPQTARAIANRNANTIRKSVDFVFPEHVDTEQYQYVKDSIPSGAVIHITEKLHGTSGRYGNVRVTRKVTTWREKVAQFILSKLIPSYTFDLFNYEHRIGTRRTVLQENGTGFYGDESFRRNAVNGIALKPDEMIYFELVGFTTTGASIMANHDTTKLPKEYVTRYGKVTAYTYGCAPGECKLFVYRITQNGVELSHNQMIARCNELGLNHVPILDTIVYDGDIETLDMIVETHMNDCSMLDNRHIREGIVLRVESEHGTQFIKSKSWPFKLMEGIIKDSDSYIDREEIA